MGRYTVNRAPLARVELAQLGLTQVGSPYRTVPVARVDRAYRDRQGTATRRGNGEVRSTGREKHGRGGGVGMLGT